MAKLPAKLCYSHLGGKLGSLLLEQFIAKGWLDKEPGTDRRYFITESGIEAFTQIGIDLSVIKPEDF